jgi:hypothetical protein
MPEGSPLRTNGTQGLSGLAAHVLFEVSELYRIAQRANVSVYGLDPGGLRATLPAATLAKGPYLLSISATRRPLTTRRDVRITLR